MKISRQRNVHTMKKLLVLFVLILPIMGSAQAKKPIGKPKPSPAPVSTPVPIVEVIPTQKVVVEKINGDRLTGLFVAASTDKITVSISDAKIDIPFNEIVSLRINEPPTPIATPAPLVEATTLAIEGAIVYKSGGAQPLARANMALFDRSLVSILAEVGAPTDRNLGYAETFGFAMLYPSQHVKFGQIAVPALQKHNVLDFSTDFQGRALLNDVRERSYWIVCYYQTRGGFAVWDLPVTIKKGSNYVTLDQTNAAVSF